MSDDIKEAGFHPADLNGDNIVSEDEQKMYLEFRRRELEDQDAMRDAQRNMTWFALAGMLLYPATVMTTELGEMFGNLDEPCGRTQAESIKIEDT